MKSDFGERLVEIRKARGLTQYDPADLIGTTQRTISYYELMIISFSVQRRRERGRPSASSGDGSPG
jgi:transcriptional regulator with XRE-family HTH domain